MGKGRVFCYPRSTNNFFFPSIQMCGVGVRRTKNCKYQWGRDWNTLKVPVLVKPKPVVVVFIE